MEFYRQECWSGLSFPPPGDLPNPGIKPVSLMSPTLAGGFFTTSTQGMADYIERYFYLDTMLTPVILPLHSTVDNAFNY